MSPLEASIEPPLGEDLEEGVPLLRRTTVYEFFDRIMESIDPIYVSPRGISYTYREWMRLDAYKRASCKREDRFTRAAENNWGQYTHRTALLEPLEPKDEFDE